MKTSRIMLAALLLIGSALTIQAAHAQEGIKRTDVLRQDLGVPGREVIQVRVDFAPGASFGRHSHPGAEVAFVIEGALEYQLDGKPPVTLRAGESLFIPAGAIHAARNVGPVNAAELATYLVEKGKPLLTLAAHAQPQEQVDNVFERAIPNAAGKNLVALVVTYAPGGKSDSHRHAGSAFVYAHVLSGAIRSQVDDEPARVYRAGEGFYELPGSHHRVSENASDREPASLLAVIVVDSRDSALTILDTK